VPFFLYGPKGTHRIVADEAERDLAIAAGFRQWRKDDPEYVLFKAESEPAAAVISKRKPGRPRKTETT
jgi:hypothetical protein